jgi:hypothetical protein
MTLENLQQTMTSDDRAKFERGCKLLEHMQAGKAFDDYWVPIGDGLLAVRRTVMTMLRLTKARGGHYNDAFGKLCAKTPYSDMHKVERSNLLYCMEHLPDILEMRVGWTPTERAKINHPTSMAQRLREFLNRARRRRRGAMHRRWRCSRTGTSNSSATISICRNGWRAPRPGGPVPRCSTLPMTMPMRLR